MNITALHSSRSILFALSLATACSAAACLNSVNDGGEETAVDAASIKGTKKNALAIFLKDLPPVSGGTGGGSSVSTGTWGGTGGAGGWSGTSNVATSTGSWGSQVATSTGSWGSQVATSTGSWGSQVATSTGSWGSQVATSTGSWGSQVATSTGSWGSSSTTGSGGAGGWEGTSTTDGVGGDSGGWGNTSSASGDWETSTGSGDWSTSSVSGGGDTTTGGGTIDPNTLYLMAGNSAPVCANPYGSSGCGSWHISVGLPPSHQHKGTFTLESLPGGHSETGPDEGGGSCWGGGGSLFGGTITILKINKKHVTFRLEGTSTMFGNKHADGTYEADLCGR